MSVVPGGNRTVGASVGIIVLDTRLPRAHGDVANAYTWPFPVLYKVARGASPRVVVLDRGKGLRDILVETGKELVDMGADGLTTTGGFLALFQDDLADACGVPVASSSLMQIPLVQRMLPRGKRVGVITVHGGKLKPDYLKIVGADPDTPVIGTEGGKELTRALLEEGATLDVAAAERDLIDAGRTLVTANPDIGALVLECHNMAPYSHGLHQALKLPIYDLYSFICWFQAGLSPRMFGRPGTYPPSVS